MDYRDNLPNNIEAPQRLYIQYASDINFDYSTGKFPSGDSEEGWIWENKYIPIAHEINGLKVGKHEWCRIKIGEPNYWTYPIRLSANITNIRSATTEVVEEDISYTEFKIIFEFEDGSTSESEVIRIKNGEDGIGITQSEVRPDGYLYITYSNGNTVNVGRVRGEDAEGLPPSVNDDWILSQSGGVPVWVDPLQPFANIFTGISPIEYNFTNGEISHNSDDGNRHIPIGGSNGFILSTDGSGSYTWLDPTELDPTVPVWVKAITETQITNWDTAYGWGDHSGLYVSLTGDETVAGAKTFSDNFQCNGQAHGGNYIKTYTGADTFNANDGNNQYMSVTGDTAIEISNLLPGTMIIQLQVNTGTPPVITIGTSLGNPVDNTPSLINANGDRNKITIHKDANGTTEYTINTTTA